MGKIFELLPFQKIVFLATFKSEVRLVIIGVNENRISL
jgi:hypothetical protein